VIFCGGGEGATRRRNAELARVGSGMVQLVGGKKEVEKMKSEREREREKRKYFFIVCLVCVSGSVVI
jgi:hypothetical protein